MTLKRSLDISVALAGLILLSPMLLLLVLLVRMKLGSPVLFRQQRPGRQGKPFLLLKFRTMTDSRDADGMLLPDEQRLTRLGQLLRNTSLDELPELWNVLRGEMSLVGPRPLLMQYLDHYTPEQARRHDVRPGITGWAQVNGRNAISWDKKFELDVWYVENQSLWLDLRILWLTVWNVLLRKGIAADDHATMPEFLGSQDAFEENGAGDSPGVLVLGAGGHGKVVISTLRALGYHVAAVYDDNRQLWGQTVLGAPICGPLSELDNMAGRPAVIAIGDGRVRRLLAERFRLKWIRAVHPAAHVAEGTVIGDGAVVFAGAVIQPESRIGIHAIINTGATVDHDCIVEDFAHIAPGAHLSGNVRLAEGGMMGTGSCAVQGVQVGRWTTVGAGGVVIQDLPDEVVAIGCPARVIQSGQVQQKAA